VPEIPSIHPRKALNYPSGVLARWNFIVMTGKGKADQIRRDLMLRTTRGGSNSMKPGLPFLFGLMIVAALGGGFMQLRVMHYQKEPPYRKPLPPPAREGSLPPVERLRSPHALLVLDVSGSMRPRTTTTSNRPRCRASTRSTWAFRARL